MRFTFFGAYDPEYPRSAVIRKGLRANGAEVRECRVSPRLKVWARYPLLAGKFRRDSGILFVPEFRQKDVPLAALLGRLRGAKVIFDPLAARFETKIGDWKRKPADSPEAWWNRRIDRAAFGLADLVLADTAAHKEYYCVEYGVPEGKVEVVPLGYDDEIFVPPPDRVTPSLPPRPTFDVLFYGSFLPLHGVDVVVEAAKIVAGRDPAVRFRLVGSGQTLERVRAAASNATAVELAGWLPMRDLPGAIAAADVCLGIFGRTDKARRVVPHKVFQAMGMGKPVITARTPAAEEFFRNRETILFCGEPLAERLAAAVLELKSDADLRTRIAGRGQTLMKDCFSPKAIGRMVIDIAGSHFQVEKGCGA